MPRLNRPRSWRHELTQWALVVAIAGGLMAALWALVALAVAVKVGP